MPLQLITVSKNSFLIEYTDKVDLEIKEKQLGVTVHNFERTGLIGLQKLLVYYSLNSNK